MSQTLECAFNTASKEYFDLQTDFWQTSTVLVLISSITKRTKCFLIEKVENWFKLLSPKYFKKLSDIAKKSRKTPIQTFLKKNTLKNTVFAVFHVFFKLLLVCKQSAKKKKIKYFVRFNQIENSSFKYYTSCLLLQNSPLAYNWLEILRHTCHSSIPLQLHMCVDINTHLHLNMI